MANDREENDSIVKVVSYKEEKHMNKNRKFNISTPDVRTVYLGKTMKQRARFIQLKEGLSGDELEKDIKAGAAIYKPFLEELKHTPTRVNIVTASTEEDGLRAVQYLAGINAWKNDYDLSDDDPYNDECFSREFDMEGDDGDFEFEIEDEEESWDENFEDEEETDDSFFREGCSRIPIIPIGEVVNQEFTNKNQIGFGAFSLEMQNNTRTPKPWWEDCVSDPVCIVKNHTDNSFFYAEEVLSPVEISCLKRFDSNENVYLLVVSDSLKEDDYSINTAILDYTANCFRVDQNQEAIKSYYKELLLYEAGIYGFKFSKNLNIPVLAEKISKIDKNYPCSRFEKVMKYLRHVKAPNTLKADSFESMGLKKLLETDTGDGIGSMETELSGMDEVKREIRNILDMQRYVKMRSSRDIKNSGYHNVHLFVGAPGTAKSTVAKLLAKKMQEEGLLQGNRFISVSGAQLKGAYVGQTAPKVHALFEQYDAIFIDEAYSLTSGSEGEGGIDSYSQEALAQLAIELEEHAADRLVIFAGYGGRKISKKNNLMHRFLESNPGISSRINSTIYFDSYSGKEMVDIIHRLASLSSLKLPESTDKDIAEFFDRRRLNNDFGNGREARMLLEQCERHVAGRVAETDPDKVTDKMLNTILESDVRDAIEDLKEKRISEQGRFDMHYGLSSGEGENGCKTAK